MEYDHTSSWKFNGIDGKQYYQRCPNQNHSLYCFKQASDSQLVVTFPDADSLMRVLEPGDLLPSLWVTRLPGIWTECVLLRLAAQAKGEHGLLPGYIMAQAARFGSHDPKKCRDCFKSNEKPSWVCAEQPGYHLVFDQVSRIKPIIVRCRSDIAYARKTVLAARGFKGPKKKQGSD